MSCNPELVSAFLDGELDVIILDTVARHLMRCDACCKTLSRLVQVRDAIAEHITIADPEAMTRSIMMAIQNEHIVPVKSTMQEYLSLFGAPVAKMAAALSSNKATEEGGGKVDPAS